MSATASVKEGLPNFEFICKMFLQIIAQNI